MLPAIDDVHLCGVQRVFFAFKHPAQGHRQHQRQQQRKTEHNKLARSHNRHVAMNGSRGCRKGDGSAEKDVTNGLLANGSSSEEEQDDDGDDEDDNEDVGDDGEENEENEEEEGDEEDDDEEAASVGVWDDECIGIEWTVVFEDEDR